MLSSVTLSPNFIQYGTLYIIFIKRCDNNFLLKELFEVFSSSLFTVESSSDIWFLEVVYLSGFYNRVSGRSLETSLFLRLLIAFTVNVITSKKDIANTPKKVPCTNRIPESGDFSITRESDGETTSKRVIESKISYDFSIDASLG